MERPDGLDEALVRLVAERLKVQSFDDIVAEGHRAIIALREQGRLCALKSAAEEAAKRRPTY